MGKEIDGLTVFFEDPFWVGAGHNPKRMQREA